MLNLGPAEIVFVLVVGFLLLGPQRLPEAARGIGKLMGEFRRQKNAVRTTVMREFYRMDESFRADIQKNLPQMDLSIVPPEELRRLTLEGIPVPPDPDYAKRMFGDAALPAVTGAASTLHAPGEPASSAPQVPALSPRSPGHLDRPGEPSPLQVCRLPREG